MTRTYDRAFAEIEGFEDSLVGIIADGLDAFVDGRGWDIRHERAKDLANAAPDLLEALKAAEGIIQQHNLLSTDTDDDRLATLVRLIHWWNHVALPALRRAEGKEVWP